MPYNNAMTVAIIGASGFLGSHLTSYLLDTTSYDIKAISKHPTPVSPAAGQADRLMILAGDIFDEDQLTEELIGVDVAYYFVHMMGQANKDFYTQEAIAANRFSAAVIAAKVKRVIYMGGLGNDHEQLSEHLLSRHNTGTLLRENCPLVLEFRASMIIGNGSVAFDIIKNLVQKLPVMALPRWSKTLTQPIALADALEYLRLAAEVDLPYTRIIEIGGPTPMTYKALYKAYANWYGKHPLVIRLPYVPEWLGGWVLDTFTSPSHAKIGRVMVHSMSNAMVVTHDHALQAFPSVHPKSLIASFDDLQEESR